MKSPSLPAHGSRIAELDGLRALAVAAVVLFHCEISGLLDAGFFGVDVFFTISGFLITGILLREYGASADIGFSNFYFRRMKRLMPPVFVVMAASFAITPLVSQDAYAWLKHDAPAALIYYSNWWQIVARQSYFDTTPHVLKHLWSLAVEEQFYFVWPLLACGIMKLSGRRATGAIAFVLALASTAWMWYMFDPSLGAGNQNRIYLGTDTHAMGLLVGAALACFYRPGASPVRGSARVWAKRAGALLSLATLAWMNQALNPASTVMYRGSFLAVPLLTGLLALGTMNDSTFLLSRLLRHRAMQWVGLRSYSIYLVHWPVFVWMRLLGWTDFAHPLVLAAGLSATGILAAWLYRFVELPANRFNPGAMGTMRKALSMTTYTLFAAVLFFVASVAAPDKGAAPVLVEAPAPVSPVPAPELPAAPEVAGAVAAEEPASNPDEKISGGEHIYAIGDSVLLGASAHLAKTIPGIRIDAAVGRQASEGVDVVKQWRSKKSSATTALVHLGTNGYINEAQYRTLLTELQGMQSVIVINVHAERRWAAPNNEIIARVGKEFANVQLIDWQTLSANRPDYFVKDGIHLTGKGILAMTAAIKLASGGTVLTPEEAATMLAAAKSAHAHTARVAAAEKDQAVAPADAHLAMVAATVEAKTAAEVPAPKEVKDNAGDATALPAAAGIQGPRIE